MSNPSDNHYVEMDEVDAELTTQPSSTPTASKTCDCTQKKTIVSIIGVIIVSALLFVVLFIALNEVTEPNKKSVTNCMKGRKVLIISMDGFRAEYLKRIPTPNIHKWFIDEGVSVPSMKPVFPSKTVPNHYTIVTGLYPPSHGIVSNKFWDPVLHKPFDIRHQGSDTTGEWFRGEPIWNTIKLKNLSTAVLQYPGSEANCGGRTINGTDLSGYPKYYRPYDANWAFEDRIDLAVELLSSKQPNSSYDLVTMYFNEPDNTGHWTNPLSNDTYDEVIKMDEYIGSFMTKLKDKNILSETDVILLSDHGMTSIEVFDNETYLNDDSMVIVIDTELFPFDNVIVRDWSPIMGVYLNGSNERFTNVDEAMDLMRMAMVHNGDKCDVYKTSDIPYKTYNYGGYNDRVPDFIVVSHLGYEIYVRGHSLDWPERGTHGYNNSEPDMQAIFMARGPSFKSGVVINDVKFENIHLYEMFCGLLCDVEPNDNNGTRGIYSKYLFK